MRDRVTINQDDFTNLCALAFVALIKDGKITKDDQDKYTDICAALMFMFTDEYQEIKKHEFK